MKKGDKNWLNGYGIRCNKCLLYFKDDEDVPEKDEIGFPICPNCKTDSHLLDHPRFYDQKWHDYGPDGFWIYKNCRLGKNCITSSEDLVEFMLVLDKELQKDFDEWVAENPWKASYLILHTYKTEQIRDKIMPQFNKWLKERGKSPVLGKDYHDAEWVPLID